MIVTSGIIPYEYLGDYPLRAARDGSIGMSGVLFEQAMTVLTAEIHRFTGSDPSPPVFNKYFLPGFATIEFNPRPDGANLDGTIDGMPGGAFWIDYILDLRAYMFLNFAFASFDLGSNFPTFMTDWLLWVGSISGTNGNFTHAENDVVGKILSTSPEQLGGSGVEYDIDLREVSFQPFSRIAVGGGTTVRGCFISTSPVFPNFMDTNGNFVRLNSRDSIVYQLITTSDFLAGSTTLDGDMFLSDTDFCVIPGTTTRDNLEGNVQHNVYTATSFPGRIHTSDVDNRLDILARVIATPPALTVGGYAVGAINNLATHPYLVVPSGTLSFTPAVPYDGSHVGSGLYVFNRSLWIQDDELIFSSGVRLLNPHDKSLCWFRFADSAVHIDGQGKVLGWTRQTVCQSIVDDGSDFLKFGITNDTGNSNDNKLAVFRFDKDTLDLSAVEEYSQDWAIFGASTAPQAEVDGASFDGSRYYLIGDSDNVFRNIYIYDSGFTLIDSKSYLTAPIQWIAVGVLTGGVFVQINPFNKVRELIIDPDPGNDTVNDTGIDYTIDVTVPGWPGTASDIISTIGPMKLLSGEPHFNDGTWCFVERNDDVVFFVRLEINGTKLEPQEGFRTSLDDVVAGVKSGHNFVAHTFT